MTTLLDLLETMHADMPRVKREARSNAQERKYMNKRGRCGSGVEYMAFEATPLGGIGTRDAYDNGGWE